MRIKHVKVTTALMYAVIVFAIVWALYTQARLIGERATCEDQGLVGVVAYGSIHLVCVEAVAAP